MDGLAIGDYALLSDCRYAAQTMVLETTFRTAAGTALLTDAMAVGRNERGHDLGAGSPGVLLREEVDAGSGEMIGNFPQAFSHIGLVNAAWAIAGAQQRAAAAPAASAGHGG